MAIASVSTRASSCFPPRFQPLRRSSRVSYLSTSSHSNFIGASASSLGFSFKEHNLFLAPLRSKRSSLLATVDNTTALPSDPMAELSFSGNSNEAYPFKESVGRNVEFEDADGDQNCVCDHKMIRVCDKLIDVFMVDKPAPTDWRRLLAFSREWNNIRPHFFRRCQERADAEGNPDMKPKLLRLGRKLKEIDEDVQRHNELLEAIESSPMEIGELVSRRRKDFTKEFFVHLHTVAESYYDNPIEQNAMAKLGNACLAAVQDYDNASESMEALHAAELKFQDIINSSTLNAACEKIDSLAEKNQLDSTLVLLITKAWSAAKDSKMMKEEVKDILYHLYVTARGNLQRLVPKEIRIIKYLLTIEDTEQQLASLRDAFTPGDELEGKDVDCLYTTPEKLHGWITTVVDAYNLSREGTLIKEAKDLMNPKIIQRMAELKKVVEKNFM